MWQRWNQNTHIFEKSDNDGATWTSLPLNASIITEGTIDPARLPGGAMENVAYTNANNVFTKQQKIQVDGVPPNNSHNLDLFHPNFATLNFRVLNAGIDRKAYRIYTDPGGIMYFELTNDAITAILNTNLILYPSGEIGVGRGIVFPNAQIASGNPNSLDDYEEGTWSPGLYASGGGSCTGGTFGSYIKIGRHVTCVGYINLTSKGSLNGELYFTFPFIAEGGVYPAVNITWWGGMLTNIAWIGASQYASNNVAYFRVTLGAQAGISGITHANIGNAFSFHFTSSYFASA